MYSFGDVVYFDKLYFADNKKDEKEKRPCIVLGEFEVKKILYLFLAPLTTSIRQFNKRKGEYLLLSVPIYNHKLSFIKMQDLIIEKASLAHETGIKINKVDEKFIKTAIKNGIDDNIYYEQIANLLKMEEEVERLNEIRKQNTNNNPKKLLYKRDSE